MADDTRYKLVNGELVPMTPEEAAELAIAAEPMPRTNSPMEEATRANQRIDAGIEAAWPKIDEAEAQAQTLKLQRRQLTVDDMQQLIDLLLAAMEVMLLAQKGPQPRDEPAPPPQPPARPTRRGRR